MDIKERFEHWRKEQQLRPWAVKDHARFGWAWVGAKGLRFSIDGSGGDLYLPHQASRAAFEVAYITLLYSALRRCSKAFVFSCNVVCNRGPELELAPTSASMAAVSCFKTDRTRWDDPDFAYQVIEKYGRFFTNEILLPSNEYEKLIGRHLEACQDQKERLFDDIWKAYVTGNGPWCLKARKDYGSETVASVTKLYNDLLEKYGRRSA